VTRRDGSWPEGINVYSQVILDEARRRDIAVEILDAPRNLFVLSHAGRAVRCWESLSDRTSAFTFHLCSDKALTSELLRRAGLPVPASVTARNLGEGLPMLERHGSVVVKPAVGEQGRGITVDVRSTGELEAALNTALEHHEAAVVEEMVQGRDLRLIVIDYRFVAAIERIPATVSGDGRRSVRRLVEDQNRERWRPTQGESQIPVDAETERCLTLAGLSWQSVPEQGAQVVVRKTANFHTGGRIVDVTEQVSDTLRRGAEEASRVLQIPVVGFDFLCPDFAGKSYAIIEANERPGLANHEPQPVPERFVDFLFPETASPL
jgi:GNAT-family acetyltransferase (TIGR03103 family)